MHDASGDKKIKQKRKEDKTMKKTMKIEGMMCGHCEARVKKTLEALDGVSSATVSHTDGTAIVELEHDVADAVLKEAVEAQDYKVKEIEA
jgi:Cu2+-exporting ATPase